MIEQLLYGSMPVPYTVLWSDEKDGAFIGECEFTGRMAGRNVSNRGSGKPIFGKPHMDRQRETIAKGWCDLCGRTLKNRTHVSLSHARMIISGAKGASVMQVEPMVHKDCAIVCVESCPSLKKDIANGTLFVRQVSSYRVQYAVLTSAATLEFYGEDRSGIVGHAKVELLKWKDRDLQWLMTAKPQ